MWKFYLFIYFIFIVLRVSSFPFLFPFVLLYFSLNFLRSFLILLFYVFFIDSFLFFFSKSFLVRFLFLFFHLFLFLPVFFFILLFCLSCFFVSLISIPRQFFFYIFFIYHCVLYFLSLNLFLFVLLFGFNSFYFIFGRFLRFSFTHFSHLSFITSCFFSPLSQLFPLFCLTLILYDPFQLFDRFLIIFLPLILFSSLYSFQLFLRFHLRYFLSLSISRTSSHVLFPFSSLRIPYLFLAALHRLTDRFYTGRSIPRPNISKNHSSSNACFLRFAVQRVIEQQLEMRITPTKALTIMYS